jgi:acyl dehydratase
MREVKQTVVARPSGLLELVGAELGASGPHVVTQEDVNTFAAVTGDDQWIHVDVERAKKGPFGTTVVHGFFTLALVPLLLSEILLVEEFSMGLNYGLDRVRFVTPLPPGTEVQGIASLVSAAPIDGGVQAKATVAVESAGESQTCCVAEILFRYYA